MKQPFKSTKLNHKHNQKLQNLINKLNIHSKWQQDDNNQQKNCSELITKFCSNIKKKACMMEGPR